jgi:peptidoglycan lytic transglycosylase D
MRNIIAVLATVIVILSISAFLYSYSKKDSEMRQKEFNDNYAVYALELPATIDFAGEHVPMTIIDVKERLDRELLVNTYWQSQTLLLIKRAARWFPVIDSILILENIPSDFKYIALAESGLMNVVSPSGAAGYWQFLPSTGMEYGLEITEEVDERYHVELATKAAINYFKSSYGQFNNWTLTAASYNMGTAGLQKLLNKQKVNNYYDLLLPDETSRYIFRILALKLIHSNPEAYGFQIRNRDLYAPYSYYNITVDSSISDFVDLCNATEINYKQLKLLNPWLRKPFLINSHLKMYTIKISKDSD